MNAMKKLCRTVLVARRLRNIIIALLTFLYVDVSVNALCNSFAMQVTAFFLLFYSLFTFFSLCVCIFYCTYAICFERSHWRAVYGYSLWFIRVHIFFVVNYYDVKFQLWSGYRSALVTESLCLSAWILQKVWLKRVFLLTSAQQKLDYVSFKHSSSLQNNNFFKAIHQSFVLIRHDTLLIINGEKNNKESYLLVIPSSLPCRQT